MKTVGIICEYNPFHKGHLYQIEKIRESFTEPVLIISLMSGSFVQRGECAIYDKYARAEAAIKCGADIVLELPYPYCSSTAEIFALAGVHVLSKLNCVDYLCFGSESRDINRLIEIAKNLDSEEYIYRFDEEAKKHKNSATSYIKIREKVYSELFGTDFARKPNDILGVEYLRAISKIENRDYKDIATYEEGKRLVPFTFGRLEKMSATRSRAAIKEGKDIEQYIPEKALNVFGSRQIYTLDNAERAILSFFRLNEGSLDDIFDMPKGLPKRMTKAAFSADSYKSFIELCKTKKYTTAKIRRCIISSLLGVTKEDVSYMPQFTVVLAANKNGTALLRKITKTREIDVITKHADYMPSGVAKRQYEIFCRADRLFLTMGEKILPSDTFIKKSPYIETLNS